MSERTPVRWLQVRQLFDQTLERPPAEREAFVAGATEGDPALRSEVLALLAADLSSSPLDTSPPGGPDGPSGEPGPPGKIGPWEVRELLGRGGMGEVYLGVRTDGVFRQEVAIKLVRPGLDREGFRARFAAERQILAELAHPGIARLLDGGALPDGRLYLILERVEGEPLDRFCERRGLDLRQRLELFLAVCAPVAHAHGRLVVHRDLKPSNILVTAEGEPKLLDFGLAKVLEPEAAGAGETRTALEWRAFTPEYASPEQVRGERVTVASDVYSLGVVLYRLLCARAPYELPSRSPIEIERVIAEREPPRPSEAAGAGGRALRGDLDTIVLKALAKEPERRYGSVAELAEDVRRYLAGLPIAARPDRLGYRLGKFLRRHRLEAAAAALAVAALLTALVFALHQARIAAAERDRAHAEAEAARRVSDFMVELFEINEPGEARGNAVTARELLDRGAERIAAQLADQPAVRAKLLRAMGRAYAELGLYEPGVAALERVVEAETAAHGPESPEVAAALGALVKPQLDRGAYREARDLALRAVALQEKVLGPGHRDLAVTYGQLGLAQWYAGDLAAARPSLERALEMQERILGPDHLDLGGLLNNVANLRWQMGEPKAARPLYERALAIFVREYGEDHPYVAHTLNNEALVDLELGDLDRARALHERALAIRRRLLASEHPDIAESLNNLGEVQRTAGDLPAARSSLQAALAIRERSLGPGHPYVGVTLHNLGMTYMEMGELGAARPPLERALGIFMEKLGAEHVHLAYPLSGLAELDHRSGELAAAEIGFRRAIALMDKGLGAGHPDLGKVRRSYAALLRDLHRPAEAAEQERLAAPAGA